MDDNNTACKILMTKTELRKSLDFVNEERERLQEDLEDYKSRIEKAVAYIKRNCITSDKWEDLGFCNFIPTGKITYKQLNKSKIIELLNILNGE